MSCILSKICRSRRPESSSSMPNVRPTPNTYAPDVPHPHPNGEEQRQGDEAFTPGDQPQDEPSSSDSTTQTDENKEMVITNVRVTDIALGLRRIPAGFYAVVNHSGLEWRTENKCVLAVNDDVIEWSGAIPIPCDPSATIGFKIYASFELQPVLGDGEQLQNLTITMEQVLDRSANGHAFTFVPKDGDVVSPCSSLMITVGKRQPEDHEYSVLKVLDPHSSTAESQNELENATNNGHTALSRYQKHGEKQDLERSIEEFEHALNVCPLEHPCRAAAQSNIAMAKFIHCQVNNTDISLDVLLTLYHNALSTRPAGHPDRPSTLIKLAGVHFARFGKRQHEVDATQAKELLDEARNLSSAESHEDRAVIFMLQLHAGQDMATTQGRGELLMDQGSTLGFTDHDQLVLSRQLLDQFKRFGVLDDLQQAISILETFILSSSTRSQQHLTGLTMCGTALIYRFHKFGELSDLEQAISRFRDAVDFTPDGHPEKPSYLNNLGNSFRARFERIGQLVDLSQAISTFRDAVDLFPDGHPDKSACLDDLGTSFFARFQRIEQLRDLEQAVLTLTDAIHLTPDGHPDKPRLLSNLAVSLKVRFQRIGQLGDLEEAISRLRDAVDLTPDGHPDKPVHLNKLADSFISHFERIGQLGDLEQAISRFKDAADLTPDGHPDKPAWLNTLGNSLLTRFERIGQLDDLEQAISWLKVAVELTPEGHSHKPGHLNNLGNAFLTRFQRIGQVGDLEQAISRLRDAVDLIPKGHPNRPVHLNNLGNSFLTRFKRIGELTDLEDAILRLMDAVGLTPDSHPHKPGRLSDLGISLLTRFKRIGQLDDLEQAISRLTDAVGLIPDGHPNKPGYLSNLGNSFIARFEHIGQLGDLEQGISWLKDSVDLTPDGHPDKPGRLNNLGNSFRARFHRFGQPDDLDDAILRQGDAVDLTPDDHPDKSSHLNNLGNSFRVRYFQRTGQLGDLEQAISRLRDAVALTPDGHPDKPACLNNFGNSFRARFERIGQLGDLEVAISRLRDAVDLTPDGHPEKPGRLNDLGNSFRARFERIGQRGDLEEAILRFGDAVDLTPDSHPEKPGRLNNLGNSLLTRFERIGRLADLEQAIARLRNAVDLIPDGHSNVPACLDSLGNSFFTRFQHIGQLGDLKQGISWMRKAVDITPDDHLDKPGRLNNLGNSLLTRFQCLGQLNVLEVAILRLRNAVDLIPDGHPLKPTCLDSLGNSFLARFERIGRLDDLEQAISRMRDTIDLTPDGHPGKPGFLNNLGNSFRVRFERIGQLGDLEQAISRLGDAVDLTPDGHPEKPTYLSNLGKSFKARFEHFWQLADLDQAVSVYSDATCTNTGAPATRFRASKHWISCARALGHPSLLHAYSSAIDLLPQMAWIGCPLTHRYRELLQGADVVREAAAASLESGHPQTAVEWLEQGRSIVWGGLFQLRSSYEELSLVHPKYASRFRELSAKLDHTSATQEKSLSLLHDHVHGTGHTRESLEKTATSHRALAIERDELLQQIRELPGFERFLLHKEFSQLRASAHSGPVVILNATESRCDVLIVLADLDDVMHVPLPNFSATRLESLQTTVKSLFHPREGRRLRVDYTNTWQSILSTLWKSIVKPVLDALTFSTPGKLSRIFWCPTGPFTFLPIHAAGLYDDLHSGPGHKVSDFVISSYVPNLSILAPSSEVHDVSSRDLRFLAVGQSPSDGLSELPGVDIELDYINAVVQNSPSTRTTLLGSSTGTVEEVLELMKGADWVHFACHGVQDDEIPTLSGLCLAGGRRLKPIDMIGLSRPRGGLAFLSACETAMGYEGLSDEAVHIAAGMLFAGYQGVIATMWSISDRVAPSVAKDVYEQLFRNGTRPDSREAARALQDAVGRIREGGASFEEWLPFIHVGL